MKVGIVGMGNMGSAIYNALSADYDVTGYGKDDDNSEIVNCDFVIIAVKPQSLDSLEIPTLSSDQVVISILAGTSIEKLKSKLPAVSNTPAIRMMPNLCASIGRSISCYYVEESVSREKTAFATDLFDCLGTSLRLDSEDDFAVGTSVFGCGPANLLYMLSAIKEFGEDKGITEAMLLELMESTAFWAKSQGNKDFETLIASVKSKGGTTERIHETWDSNGLKDSIIEGLKAGQEKEESGDY